MNRSNLMLVQGGGPTQVVNATLGAMIEEAGACGAFGRILGSRGGTKGLAEGKAMDLGRLAAGELGLIRTTPGAALGSSRFKPSEDDMGGILKNLQRWKVRDILFLGGNGTMVGAAALLRYCRHSGYEVRIVGVPKTIDNDIAATDRCPGYGSAARYVAQATRELGLDIRSLPQPVSIFETMGRSVGWLAAASTLGKRDEADAPHLVYLPEKAFILAEFLTAIDDAVTKHGWAVVVVPEGLRDRDGNMVFEKRDPAQADPLNRPLTGGVGQFLADRVAAELKMRCRCEKPGLLGRCSSTHIASQDVKDAETVGRAGVRGLLEGRTSQMVSLLPLEEAGASRYEFVEFHEVAGIERRIPAKWIGEGPIPVKDGFLSYLRPLAGSLPQHHAPLSSELDFHGDA